MVSKIQKWGNSQGVELEKQTLEDADLSIGDDVEIIVQEGQILVRKLSKSKFDLNELLSRMPDDYEVREESFGKPVGKEEW
ncbi:MAG: transcriptional regulator/antitoxin, MazE [Blastocatellia bacterium]|nr:transcriptional regulator/antitoxin, MazE [Blastocatellia bacterium]